MNAKIRTARYWDFKYDFNGFIGRFKSGGLHKRKPSWSETKPEGRWRALDYEDLTKRDTLSLDVLVQRRDA